MHKNVYLQAEVNSKLSALNHKFSSKLKPIINKKTYSFFLYEKKCINNYLYDGNTTKTKLITHITSEKNANFRINKQ